VNDRPVLADGLHMHYNRLVNPTDLAISATISAEAAAEEARIVREAALIAEADADIAAGRFVESSVVKAWIDSIGTGRELPVPYSGR